MKRFRELADKLSTEARARADARARDLLEKGLTLDELRDYLEIKREDLARSLMVDPSFISQFDCSEMNLTMLRDVLRAMGAELEIYATFPEGRVRLNASRGA